MVAKAQYERSEQSTKLYGEFIAEIQNLEQERSPHRYLLNKYFRAINKQFLQVNEDEPEATR